MVHRMSAAPLVEAREPSTAPRPGADGVPRISAVPTATYRLQFSPRFRFVDATALVPYLAGLGISHLYASPYLRARPGSEHGYDVIDPNSLNPEIGTPQEHAALIEASQRAGLGHILDFVPNHMGISGNPWWHDVLEWGEDSPYAEYFDIDWRPQRRELHGKVLLPFLGDHYGAVLDRGELIVIFAPERGAFEIAYFERRFPLATASYEALLSLAAEKHGDEAWPLRALAAEFPRASRERSAELKTELATVAREPANAVAIEAALARYRAGHEPQAADRLDALLASQHYRLAFWRVSVDEINYRRFFDINDLAAVRVEDAEVLAQTHRFAFELIGEGRVQGLRIDHVDGLYNPESYCNLLGDRAAALGHPQYLVVEKVLAPFEHLRSDWRIAGTTGYDFLNLVNGLFVDGRSELAFDRLYRRFAGVTGDFDQFAYRAKKDIMRTSLASELGVLATMLDRIAESDRRSNDYTFNVLRDALVEVIASFPVYRTYVTSEELEEDDRRFIEWAVGVARKRSQLGDDRVFDFIESVLTVAAPQISPNYERRAVLRFAMKFQQYTSPVTAKGVEDTAFYRYVRLLSLNEVGGDPRRFGTSVAAFHRENAERAEHHPHALLATATHDHKRGEDVRTRLDALTEMPGLWDRTIRRWSRLNARKKRTVDGTSAPTENDEYALYQTLLGTWPAGWLEHGEIPAAERAAYVERIEAYLRKAIREAKFRSSWTNPNVAYEDAAFAFVDRILAAKGSGTFQRELASLARECATLGMFSSLAQTTLKLTSPGIPDLYQGTEVWDLSLVDPDNRRAVDYQARGAMLIEFEAALQHERALELCDDLLRSWPDGRIKAYVVWRLLHLRRDLAALFLQGNYVALETSGARGEHLVAFAREGIVTLAPRLVRRLLVRDERAVRLTFGDERVLLARNAPRSYQDVFTGAVYEANEAGQLGVAEILGCFPVAVLVPRR
jgi:(1->4)-alpha-D-glucan 1-alpha-D-glucosylmutase